MSIRLRDRVEEVINRLNNRNPCLVAGFCHIDGCIKAILVDDKTKKAVGIMIPLGRILDRPNDAVILADEHYDELVRKLEDTNRGGRQVIIPFQDESK